MKIKNLFLNILINKKYFHKKVPKIKLRFVLYNDNTGMTWK